MSCLLGLFFFSYCGFPDWQVYTCFCWSFKLSELKTGNVPLPHVSKLLTYMFLILNDRKEEERGPSPFTFNRKVMATV